ncbi:MAG TPA: type II and III secretion system protein family protein [Bauldia sp.]|nr:type II and III secretion system protein family protein [Bauldia sp.]
MTFPRMLLIAGAALLLAGGLGAAGARADTPASGTGTYDAGAVQRAVKVGLDKSLVIDLPRDARDILVSNPAIADAVIRTPRRIYVTGVAVGESNVIVFDRAGQQIVSLELSVERDTAALTTLLHQLLPDSNIQVEIVSDNLILSGGVRNAADSRRAQDIANVFLNGGAQAQGTGSDAGGVTVSSAGGASVSSTVVNMLTIQGQDQVQVKVSVAEINRNLVKQLGISWNAQNIDIASILGLGNVLGQVLVGGSVALPFPVTGSQPPSSISGTYVQNYLTQNPGSSSTDDPTVAQRQLGATIRALEQTGLYRTLAEPTLTAISGESASFLAGGEFPVPTGKDQSGNVTISFKPFGVALSMTPVVLDDGRISLHVKTEVSELSTDGAVALGPDVSIPSLKVRRAETTLELPSGGSMVLGGLLEDSTRQAISALPGLGKLPILGALFRSRDFQRDETELVIIATPYLVRPVSRDALATPDQGFAPASDAQAQLLGNLNRIYGSSATPPPSGGKYQGTFGYIYQ